MSGVKKVFKKASIFSPASKIIGGDDSDSGSSSTSEEVAPVDNRDRQLRKAGAGQRRARLGQDDTVLSGKLG